MINRYYLVEIKMYISCYEKAVKSVQRASSEEEAAFLALKEETHNEPLTREEFDNVKEWCDDGMVYTTQSVRVVTRAFHDEFNNVGG